MLTGGDDIQPQLYRPNLSKKLRGTVSSPDRTRDLVELLLVREAVRQHKPLLAICRGQQLLNVAFGGTLITDIPTECPRALNHQRFDRKNAPVHSINLAPDSQLARVLGRSTVRVNSTHHQAVARIGTGLRATAFSDDGLIEALESNLSEIAWSSFVLAVQFHPERLWPKYPEFLAIFETFIHACFGGSNKGL
jgi:putative glutamine amidotransferase